MLPTLMPAIASWSASVSVMAWRAATGASGPRDGCGEARLGMTAVAGGAAKGGRVCQPPTPRRDPQAGDYGLGARDASAAWPITRMPFARATLASLVPLENIARPRARPLHRFPLSILHHHRHERQVADVMLRRERARRRDWPHAVIMNAFERGDQAVGGEIGTRALHAFGEHIHIAVSEQIEIVRPTGRRIRIRLLPRRLPLDHLRRLRARQIRNQREAHHALGAALRCGDQSGIDHIAADEERLLHAELLRLAHGDRR